MPVLYSAPPPNPQGLQGQSEQSAESKDSLSGLRAVRVESEALFQKKKNSLLGPG